VIIYFQAGNRRGGKGGRGGRGGKVLNMFVQEAEQIAILVQIMFSLSQDATWVNMHVNELVFRHKVEH
jgi:hypothetical protein